MRTQRVVVVHEVGSRHFSGDCEDQREAIGTQQYAFVLRGLDVILHRFSLGVDLDQVGQTQIDVAH